MSAILTINGVLKDPARMDLVAAETERLYMLHERGTPEELAAAGLGPRPASAATAAHPAGEIRRHGVFVFAETRDYLPALREALQRRMGGAEIVAPELEPTRVSILRGGVAKTAVGDARRARAHIVLTTYGFSRRGISLPDMTAIVEATPRRNGMRQILGRILRRGSDESIVRQVVDIVDCRTGLKGQAADRRKIYREKGYPISKVAVSWDSGAAPAAEAAAQDEDSAFADWTSEELLAAAMGDGEDD
jgi:hypothetical protein